MKWNIFLRLKKLLIISEHFFKVNFKPKEWSVPGFFWRPFSASSHQHGPTHRVLQPRSANRWPRIPRPTGPLKRPPFPTNSSRIKLPSNLVKLSPWLWRKSTRPPPISKGSWSKPSIRQTTPSLEASWLGITVFWRENEIYFKLTKLL